MTNERCTAYIQWKGEHFGILRVYGDDPIKYVWTCPAERYDDNQRLHLQGFLKGPKGATAKAIREYCAKHDFTSIIWETVTEKAVTHVEVFANPMKMVRHKTYDVEAFLARVKQ